MNDVFRTLVYENEVSLTIADTTNMVKKGIQLHNLSAPSAYLFGRGMSALTYMSSGLKEETGELSLQLQCDGKIRSFSGSGNRALTLRGYVENSQVEEREEGELLGENGSIILVRDDGYNRPFVGACAFPENPDFDKVIEEYYRISEQLPTRIKTVVKMSKGECVFAGVIALQPLPFASAESLKKMYELNLAFLLDEVEREGIGRTIEGYFGKTETEERTAVYQCNCSREKLTAVLVTLGEEQFRDILRTEGIVRAHCHYCNTDYVFTEKDVDEIFPKKA